MPAAVQGERGAQAGVQLPQRGLKPQKVNNNHGDIYRPSLEEGSDQQMVKKIYTTYYLSLCTQTTADPNPFRSTNCISMDSWIFLQLKHFFVVDPQKNFLLWLHTMIFLDA